jgi:hypothetical protein
MVSTTPKISSAAPKAELALASQHDDRETPGHQQRGEIADPR